MLRADAELSSPLSPLSSRMAAARWPRRRPAREQKARHRILDLWSQIRCLWVVQKLICPDSELANTLTHRTEVGLLRTELIDALEAADAVQREKEAQVRELTDAAEEDAARAAQLLATAEAAAAGRISELETEREAAELAHDAALAAAAEESKLAVARTKQAEDEAASLREQLANVHSRCC